MKCVVRLFCVCILASSPASLHADLTAPSNAASTSNYASSYNRAYNQALLAPDGKHFAVIAPIRGGTGLMIFNIQNMQAVAAFNVESNQTVLRFWWANSERIIVNLALKGLSIEYPLLLGELFAFNIDNTKKFPIAGFAAGDNAEYQFLDALHSDNERIRVVRRGIKNKQMELTRPAAYTLDIYKRARVSTGTNIKELRLRNRYNSPYPTGGFVADCNGELRLAFHVDQGDILKVSRRDYSVGAWVEISGFAASVTPASTSKARPIIGFDSQNEGIFYLGKTQHGTTGLFHLNLQSAKVTALHTHEKIDISEDDIIFASDNEAVGINLKGESAKFFAQHREIPQLQSLLNAFEDSRVNILNYSTNGELALIDVESKDDDSGLYLFDARNNSLSILMQATI